MISRSYIRMGGTIARTAESRLSRFRRNPMQCSALLLSSSQTASQTAQENYELKTSSGGRLSGAEYLSLVRERLGAPKEATEGEQDLAVPLPAFEALIKEYDILVHENMEWKDRYTRALAETENVRRRGTKLVADTKTFAIQGFCKDLLEVADILELAIASVKPEDLNAGGKPMKDLHDGISMTKTVLLKTFAKHGVRPDSPIGEKFDPNLHEAVFQVPKAQAKQDVGYVEHVMKIGYKLQGRPIRPAQVGVVFQ